MATERAKKETTLAIGSSVWYDISPKHLRLLKAAADAVLEASGGTGIT